MLDQSFSAHCLRRLLQKEDVAKFRLWRPSDDKDAILDSIATNINSPSFAFPPFHEKTTKNRIIYSAPDAKTILAIRKLDHNIRAIYKVKQADRNSIIHQVKSLLREGCDFSVFRFDISSFYESVDRKAVLSKIDRDSIVSYMSRRLLDQLFSIPQFTNMLGVPRGLAVSATLSELFMREFDRQIKILPQVYFYARYVDDIIIFAYGSIDEVKKEVEEACSNMKIKINPKPDKQKIITCSGDANKSNTKCCQFDFLGYKLQFREFLDKRNGWRDVVVRIAESKLRKIKTRIVHCFIAFTTDGDFGLLEKRLKFVCGNHILKKSNNGILYGGFYYNYQHLSSTEDLDDLNKFLRKLVFAQRGSIGIRISRILTFAQRRKLVRLNFRTAFEKRLTKNIPRLEMKEIQRCWQYEKN